MSETAPAINNPAETKQDADVSPYEGLDRSTIDAIIAAKASVDEESKTPSADLRTAVREALEASGDERAFRRVYDMNNLELNAFVEGASVEKKDRRVDELNSLIEAYDNNDSFADRRTAIREALEAAGDTKAFRTVYDMNNLDLTRFIDDARQALQEETSMGEAEALEAAYAEKDQREAEPAESTDEKKARSPEEFSKDDSPEQMIADIGDLISKETDPVKVSEAQEKLRDIMIQIQEILDGKGKKADDIDSLDDASAPKVGEGEKSDLDDLDKAEAPKVDDKEADDLEDLDDKEAPKVVDAADKKDTDGEEHDDLEDLDDLSAPEVGEAPAETEDTRRWYKRAWDRAGLLFIRGMNAAGERMHLPEKRSTRVATAIGAVTLLAVGGALAWKYGFHHGGSGGSGNNTDPSAVPTPKPKGTPTPEVPVPTPKGPEVPNADNYAHPWNWMKAAIDNGSVKPPQGMGPEQALHHYGQMAAEAGHKVEWYNLPNGLEAIRIDGSDDTKAIGDILSQFAK